VHVFPLSSDFGGQRETFYIVRIEASPGTPGFSKEKLRAEGLTGSRWWTLAELKGAASVRFAPARLPELYEAILRDGAPAEVIDTGI